MIAPLWSDMMLTGSNHVRQMITTFGNGPVLRRAESNNNGNGVTIYICHYPIKSYTPCGVWVDVYGKQKFVNLRATRQWASATDAEAMYHLKRRKQRQIPILKSQLDTATRTLAYLNELSTTNEV